MLSSVDKTEKKVLLVALVVSAVHLLLIGSAVAFLNINVPTCQPNEQLITQGSLRPVGPKHLEVHYLAKMWSFEPRKIVIPVGTTVDFFVGSKDVVHGFHIYHTNVNLMAVPGVINKATHKFNTAGLFHIVCHEYCGMGHQNMNALIEVSESAASASSDLQEAPPEGASLVEAAGRKLYEEKGCVACHSLDGKPGVGPSFKGIYGQPVELADGTSVTVDDAYLSEAIKNPSANLVKGYGAVMPVLPLTEDEIKSLIEFIKTVK